MRFRVWSLVVLLLVALGCATTPTTNPPAPPAPGAASRSITTTLRNGFVEVAVKIPAGSSGPWPVIISPYGDESALLARGFAVARHHARWSELAGLGAPDPAVEPAPGSSTETPVGTWMLRSPRPGVVGRGYFGFVHHDVAIVSEVLDFLEQVPELDPTRIGIAGSSTSGFVALEATAREPRIAATAVQASCGDYHAFLRDSRLALAGDERWLEDGEIVLDDDYEAELRAREPYRQADRFPPRPLVLLHGEQDKAVPFRCARRTAERLAAAYGAAGVPERFRFVTYPGRGHDLSPDSGIETLRFFERWLGAPTAPE